MKHLVFTVTNDLTLDQRMDRICSTLSANGYNCTLVGRRRRKSMPLVKKSYRQVRLWCLFESGKLFYLEYNFKLLLHLLFHRFSTVCAIDLDTLLPAYLASKVKGKKLVYDAHEYFTEMEEIVRRPMIHKAWKGLEKFMMKRLKHAYTISEGYAELFQKNYGVEFEVIRNVPRLKARTAGRDTNMRFIIYQGALNMGRGLEQAIEAMQHIDECKLHIYGDGPLSEPLKQLTKKLGVDNRVDFKGILPPEKLRKQTERAWLGLTLFSETGLHHRFSLANRFFDYLHAGIPQIAMNYPEYQTFNSQCEVAVLLDTLDANAIVSAVKSLYYDPVHYDRLTENTSLMTSLHCWDKESIKLLSFYRSL